MSHRSIRAAAPVAVSLVAVATLVLGSPATTAAHPFTTIEGSPVAHFHYFASKPETWQGIPWAGPGWYVDNGRGVIRVKDPNPTHDWTVKERVKIIDEDLHAYPVIRWVAAPEDKPWLPTWPTRYYNCHGYSFWGSWQFSNLPLRQHLNIHGASVRTIIEDQGWTQLGSADPKLTGNIAVWWGLDEKGRPIALHSGVVSRTVGSTIYIYSKWGDKGLYEHPTYGLDPGYGNDVRYYTRGAPLTGK